MHRVAHSLGMRTTATMMFGCGETLEQRMHHLEIVREIQADTGGFTAFIPWTFQRENTSLGRFIKEEATAVEYLKTLAISRIYLDNFPNLQASWVTQGLKGPVRKVTSIVRYQQPARLVQFEAFGANARRHHRRAECDSGQDLYSCAAADAQRHREHSRDNLADRVAFVAADVFALPQPLRRPFDHVLCNPPFHGEEGEAAGAPSCV